MKRLALAVVLGGCTPPADTVGAWTTEASTAGQGSSSEGVAADSSTSVDESSTSAVVSSSSSSESSSESSTTSTAGPTPWVATIAPGSPARLRVVDLDSGAIVEV